MVGKIVRLYLVFAFLKGQYESKYGLKSDSMKVAEKHKPNRWIYYDVKSTLKIPYSKKMEITYSSKVWNIKEEGSMWWPGERNHYICTTQRPVHKRSRSPGLPCQVTKKVSSHERVSVTREITMLSLPTVWTLYFPQL